MLGLLPLLLSLPAAAGALRMLSSCLQRKLVRVLSSNWSCVAPPQLTLCRTTKLPDIGAMFEKHMKRHNAAAFGLAGDRTQHLLWRLVDGEVSRVWCGCRVI